MNLQVGVKVLLRNSEGRFLILRRVATEEGALGGVWDIPGGRMEAGSSLMENLSREVMEEAGLALTSTPVLIAAQDIIRPPERHTVRLTYAAVIEGTPVLDGKEHDAFKWVTYEEMAGEEALDTYLRELVKSPLPKG